MEQNHFLLSMASCYLPGSIFLPPISSPTSCLFLSSLVFHSQTQITPVVQSSLVPGDSGGRWVSVLIPKLATQPQMTYCYWDSPSRGAVLVTGSFSLRVIYLLDIFPWAQVYHAYVYNGNCRNFRMYRWVLLWASCVLLLALSYIKSLRL